MMLLAIPAAAALGLLVQALFMEQPVGPRTLSLAAVVAVGALLAALPPAAFLVLLGRGWSPWLRSIIGGLLTTLAFVPATMFAFALEIRVIEGRVEADSVADLTANELFWSLFGGMGLFTPTGLRYLLPWPVLAVALATLLCFYHWPTARSASPISSRPRAAR
jgi:uncharacterized membrane protein YqaE (UPF0057 family)